MNTNTHSATPAADPNALVEELRARVPEWMKEGVNAVAKPRVLGPPDILREAVQEYLERRGIRPPMDVMNPQPVKEAA